MTQFPMNDVAALGLLKIDFLGLRNLDVIDKALELIGDLALDDIPIDDAETYAMLARGESTGVFQFESSGMREALRQVKPTEFDDLIALVALYRPGPMGYIPVYAQAQERPGAGHVHRPAARADHVGDVRDLHLPGAVPRDREADRRLHARRGGRPAQGDRQEDPLADGVAEGEVPRGLRAERHDARGREPALEGHGAVAGLLLQQGARRVLRADRVPHRVAARAPPARVHGGAHLLGDEHEGPRAVLRQRVPRDGDRGAAARRELLAVRLRRRRGEDPLRAQRGEERRRQRRARDRRRARAGRAVRVDLGLHRARRPGASRTSARSSRSSSAAR